MLPSSPPRLDPPPPPPPPLRLLPPSVAQRLLFVAGRSEAVLEGCSVLGAGGSGLEVGTGSTLVCRYVRVLWSGRSGVRGRQDCSLALMASSVACSGWAGVEGNGACRLLLSRSCVLRSGRGGLLLMGGAQAEVVKSFVGWSRFSNVDVGRGASSCRLHSCLVQGGRGHGVLVHGPGARCHAHNVHVLVGSHTTSQNQSAPSNSPASTKQAVKSEQGACVIVCDACSF